MNKLNGIFNNLIFDKEIILANIDQEEAFSKLFGDQEVSINSSVLNILRDESQSSVRFMWTADNRLYARDFADTSYTGDIVDWIKFYNRDVNKKIITTNQALKELSEGLDIDMSKKLDGFVPLLREKDRSKIEIEAKLDDDGYATFDAIDLEYWSQFGITQRSLYLLAQFGIFSCKRVWIEKNTYTEKFTNHASPIYAYYFDVGKYKIYTPNGKKEHKWRCNHSLIDDFGFDSSNPNKKVILTKSRKDRIVWKLLGYEAYCFTAEIVPDELPYDTHLVFYDNDYDKPMIKNTGVLRGAAIANKFNIPYRYLDSKYECTDLAEMVQKYGLSFTRSIVSSIMRSIPNTKI